MEMDVGDASPLSFLSSSPFFDGDFFLLRFNLLVPLSVFLWFGETLVGDCKPWIGPFWTIVILFFIPGEAASCYSALAFMAKSASSQRQPGEADREAF